MLKRFAIALVTASVLGVGVSYPLLAQEPESGPVGQGGRVEVAEAGYALTVPDEWVTVLPSAEDAGAITDALSDIDPDLAATAEAALASGVGFSLLLFGALDAESEFRENCNVIDSASDGMSLELGVAAAEDALSEMGDQLASGPDITMLELPAGEVARIDYGLQYPGLETAHAAYYFIDGSTFHLLTCTSVERAEDDWLSIAETFEFLIAEEQAEALPDSD